MEKEAKKTKKAKKVVDNSILEYIELVKYNDGMHDNINRIDPLLFKLINVTTDLLNKLDSNTIRNVDTIRLLRNKNRNVYTDLNVMRNKLIMIEKIVKSNNKVLNQIVDEIGK